jgi:undecaprenyl phosphate N,N'-diacetylbacillosamine 1-phosphate transferase
MVYRKYLKRFFDFTLSLLLLIITSPLIVTISIILYFTNNGKIFFIQPRPGKNENIFFIIKFRTMNEKVNNNGELLPDNERITRIGNFIRKTSIDELPQLINVLKGDLSFIGPRPLLVDYLPLYNDFQRRRHEVKPGITGWAQVNGRNAISWQKKFEYDIWYVDNICFLLDVKIIFLTIKKIFLAENINTSDTTTMVRFTGTDS